ncbi:ATP-binding cassette domain-containing protein [Paenibacillus sp. NPDC058071]|uniref:ABC transporter ATP-binding protein n=1 Tax=Paenibacillus sp. NPDC058071 TaxID=3346326 RepID=UPI0036DB8512
MALLKAEALAKRFGTKQAVKNISFSLAEGRCTALLGPNGAGKTTTLRMLAGLLSPSSGELSFQGRALGSEPRTWLGYLPQSPTFYNWMTGREFVVYAGRLCGLSAQDSKRRTEELLERVGLKESAGRTIGGYSGGMKQRLGLAQALVHRPALLMLDEPVSALDPLGRHDVLELLEELKRETTILFSTHVLHDAEQLCDDVIIIRDGAIAVQGSLEEIRQKYRVPVITLHTERDEDSENWRLHFKDSGFVKEVRRIPSGLQLEVDDLERAREQLLKRLAEDRVRVARLEFGHSTLEELFMKVVSE